MDPTLLATLLDLNPGFLAEVRRDGTLLSSFRLPGNGGKLQDYLCPSAPFLDALHKGPPFPVLCCKFHERPGPSYEAKFALVQEDPERVLILFTDISNQNATIENLERSQERLLFAAEAMGVGLWSWDARTDTIEWDQELCRLYGRTSGPANYQEYLDCIHPDDRRRVMASIESAMKTGIYEDVEHRVLLPEGGIRWLYAKARVVRGSDGGPARMLGGAIDVGARKALEEQLRQAQKLEAVGQLTAGIAHNFNNILMGILPSAQLAAMEAPPSLLPYVRDIEYSARRAAELVHQLMTFTRQRQPQAKHPEYLSEIARKTLKICRNTFPPEMLLSESYPEPEVPVMASAGQLEQVLLNLLLNARDALVGCPDPHIHLQIHVLPANHPGLDLLPAGERNAHLKISISDNGHGMQESVRRRVFEPFFTTKPPGQGTGLGLAVTYAIIQEHRGHITCSSVPGAGSSFHVYLPLHVSKEKRPVMEDAPPLGQGQRILLVDDEETVRRVLSAILSLAGYKVYTAANGEEALLMVDQLGWVDLVLLDLAMPRLSGAATIPYLRKRGLTIALLTGQHAAEMDRSDVAMVLEKPLDRTTLLKAVHKLMSQAP